MEGSRLVDVLTVFPVKVSSPKIRTPNPSECKAKGMESTNSVTELLGVIVRRTNGTSTPGSWIWVFQLWRYRTVCCLWVQCLYHVLEENSMIPALKWVLTGNYSLSAWLFQGNAAYGKAVESLGICSFSYFLCCKMDQVNHMCDTVSIAGASVNLGWLCYWRLCGEDRQTLSQAHVKSRKNNYYSI